MLYLENPTDTFTPWQGEPINNIRHPLTIESQWTADELASVGLFIAVEPAVPDGKVVTGSHAERIDGAVTLVYDLTDAPPPELAPYQFRAMLALSGKQADLDAYIAALPDPQKTIAQAKLDYSLTFRRDNDLVLAAQQALGLTDAELDAMWAQAAAIT